MFSNDGEMKLLSAQHESCNHEIYCILDEANYTEGACFIF